MRACNGHIKGETMANSERKIIRGVRVGGKTYVSGQEDELNKVIVTSEIERLTGKGYLEGKWDGKSPQSETKLETKPESGDAAQQSETETEDLSTLKKDELLAKAEQLGVAVDSSLTKAEIIEAIQGKE
jgi:hypothetical protein